MYCSALGPPVDIPIAITRLGGTAGRALFLFRGRGISKSARGILLAPPARFATLIFSMSGWQRFPGGLPAASLGLEQNQLHRVPAP